MNPASAWLEAIVAPVSVVGSRRMGAEDSLFSGAAAYERFMGRWSRAIAVPLARFAGVRNGEVVLDVGCGTGALATAIAGVAPAAKITGIDPAPAYVAFAQAKRPTADTAFEVGNAQALRFADGTFDRVLSLLALNFVPDPQKAVAEMQRVTRAGGTVAVAVWDYGEGMEMLRVFWDAAIALRPEDDGKDERHMPLSRRGELAALWRSQDLEDAVEEGLTVETRFSSFDDYWSPFTEKQGPAGAYVAGLPPAQRDALRQRVRRRLLGDGPDRPIVLSARAWAVRGVAGGEP